MLLGWGGLVSLGALHLVQRPSVQVGTLPARGHLSPDAARTLGRKWALNDVSAEELAQVAGLGRKRAAALVEERTRVGGFTDWKQVDAVRGVGPSALKSLQDVAGLARGSPAEQ